jgi:hypothetical protein
VDLERSPPQSDWQGLVNAGVATLAVAGVLLEVAFVDWLSIAVKSTVTVSNEAMRLSRNFSRESPHNCSGFASWL